MWEVNIANCIDIQQSERQVLAEIQTNNNLSVHHNVRALVHAHIGITE